MKNKLRAIGVLILAFLLIEVISYSILAVKIILALIIGGLTYGLYTFVLEIINEMFPNDR